MVNVGPVRVLRVVERWELPSAMERAQGCCESCRDDSDLRVVEDDNGVRFIVLCASCRLRARWAPTMNGVLPSRSGRRVELETEP